MGSSPVVSIGEPAERFPRHKDYGVLAQLVARHIRIVEATGSNPVYSIVKSLYRAIFHKTAGKYGCHRGAAL